MILIIFFKHVFITIIKFWFGNKREGDEPRGIDTELPWTTGVRMGEGDQQ